VDLFGLIKNSNPKVKVGMRPRAAHEVPLLQATASRVVNMEETPTISTSTGTPSAMEKSPLDFADEDVHLSTELGHNQQLSSGQSTCLSRAGGSHYSTRVLFRDATPTFRGLPEPI
ncbi:hypothetical protein Tco_0398963, partial [Tanacetum coccineum]